MTIRTLLAIYFTLALVGGANARTLDVPVHDPTDNAIGCGSFETTPSDQETKA